MGKIEDRLKELRTKARRTSSKLSPPVLVINGYAGSLTVAASQLGLEILGSYEDSGHGLEIQRHNFPNLNYVEKYPWPNLNLEGSLVIAHPPCAGFCAQNVNAPSRATTRGLDGTYFSQTKSVLEYSLAAKAIAV